MRRLRVEKQPYKSSLERIARERSYPVGQLLDPRCKWCHALGSARPVVVPIEHAPDCPTAIAREALERS